MRWYRRRTDHHTRQQYYEHRANAEWSVDRPLEMGEIVHHRNCDRNDNHPDNLQVLPNQRVHMLLHHLERREARGLVPLFDRDDLIRAWQRWPCT